jgi:hypothetical protein
MVVDSQTQTISLIYQGQRGTENFWVLNSGRRLNAERLVAANWRAIAVTTT